MRNFSDRQKEIIEKSIEIIVNKSIHDLTIKNLSESIGISEPALYRHFKNKADILIGILDFIKQNIEDVIDKSNKLDGNSIEKIEFIFLSNFKKFSDNPALSSALSTLLCSEEISQNDKKLSQKVLAIINMKQDNLINIITQGIKKKEIRNDIPIETLSLLIMGSLRLLIRKWQLSKFDFDLVLEGKKHLDALKKLIIYK